MRFLSGGVIELTREELLAACDDAKAFYHICDLSPEDRAAYEAKIAKATKRIELVKL